MSELKEEKLNNFQPCSYFECRQPACYKWLDENKSGEDVILFYSCIEHSKLICELYNKKNHAQNHEIKKFAKGEYRAAINLAKYQMPKDITKEREEILVNPE